MRRHLTLCAALALAASGCPRVDPAAAASAVDASTPRLRPRLSAVGPRLLSNQTSTPLVVTGANLATARALVIGPPVERTLPLVALDDAHAFTRFPADVDLGGAPETLVTATLEGGEGQATLRLIDDARFPDLVALAATADERWLAAVSTTDDTVYALETATRRVMGVKTADGPTAVARLPSGELVVTHLYSPTLALLSFREGGPAVTRVPGPAMAAAVAVTDDGLVLVAEHARDSVVALDAKAGFAERWRTPVAPNPRALAVTPAGLAVGSLQTGEVELLALETGRVLATAQPGPGTPIVGGTTRAYARYVMNGKAPRALVASPRLGRLFLSSIGPNVGPNPDKMEVSMNGGVAALLAPGADRRPALAWQRHLGFGAGVTEALALDDAAGLLYATDVGLGLVRVVDARRLARSDADGARALLQELALPPPQGFPSIRPAEDFNVKGRAGPSLHSGPRALWLSKDRKTLWVLNRFSGTVARLDVSRAAAGKAAWLEQVPLVDVLGQRTRRLGQVLYHADLGRTAMSCDACHLDGHGEGVLFEKTVPLRIYRSTTVRGSRETPPYFTPASTHSMGETAKVVGARNRFQNPPLTPDEVEALTLYSSLIPTLPNPFVDEQGVPRVALRLPDGATGNARRGLALFEGKAACGGCHPAPLYTTDQDEATRGRFLDVGTPRAVPLREDQQNTRFEGFGTPALAGAWDVFPMLTTGLAGLEVRADGSLGVATRFPLRAAVERWAPGHGRADLLLPEERDDLLAFVLSL
ncbi:MAG: MtsA protein [Myxococcaceae bacterium]|nr:MtsA protein [Myxococcaceae bacterium]